MLESEMLSRMVPPSKERNCWGRGILQIMITRVCDLACPHCTAGSSLGGKMITMTPDQFAIACDSLSTYFGIRAVFGGNPAASRYFEEICSIAKEKIPFEHSGIWCNHPLGKAKFMRGVYNPATSNLNCHLSREAFDEFQEWEEAVPYLKGLDPAWPEAQAIIDTHERAKRVGDSRHSPPFVAPIDLGYTQEEMNERISRCPCNQEWSALIGIFRGQLRGWFCEEAAHISMLHELNPDWRGTGHPIPDTGIDVAAAVAEGREWWNQGMDAFAHQVRECCYTCGLPLNGYGQLAVGDNVEQYTKTHEFIMRPKRKDRLVQLVTNRDELKENGVPKMTTYIQNSSLPVIQ